MTDLAFTPAAVLARLIASRALSPVELVDMILARIERAQPALNPFITVTAEAARAAARVAEATVIRGDALGPLFGVPFSVKDLVNTAGVRTTFGSVALADNVPAADSVAVARLKRAGAILIGKTTTPEFGHKPFTEAPLFGRTANAWDQSRTAGGSGGVPAACNGVVGFKQTLGLIPHDLTPDGFGNQSYIMPITRTVMDSALMLRRWPIPTRATRIRSGCRSKILSPRLAPRVSSGVCASPGGPTSATARWRARSWPCARRPSPCSPSWVPS